MVKLRCKNGYRNRSTIYTPGQVIEVAQSIADWLSRDAPGCFEEVKPRKRRMRKPPADKAIHEATEK